MSHTLKKTVFFIAMTLSLTPLIDPPLALLLGFILAQTTGHPWMHLNGKVTGWLLKSSVVGLGFGVNLHHAAAAGKDGLIFTVFSILTTLTAGWFFGRMFKVDFKTSFLISSGTAICGGSAIAAVAPIIDADEKQISIALGTVFILNSAALFIFPVVGHLLGMTQYQFGMWSAIAIHDTSSVVGAAAKFGEEALQIATTVKLERALWIIPLSFFTVFLVKGDIRSVRIPYFIALYVIAMTVGTFLPGYQPLYGWVVFAARKGLTLTLFLIGSGLSYKSVRAVGIRPLMQGVMLWASVILISLTAIMAL